MDGMLLSVRTTLIMAFRALPLILILFIGFLAAGLGNFALFFLFIGHVVVVPTATSLSQMIFSMINNNKAFMVEASDKAVFVQGAIYSSPFINVAPSFWMAHILFFMSYIIANAISILRLPANPKADIILVSSRKSKARTLIITNVCILIILCVLKYQTNTETLPGIAVAVVLGGGLGYLWYLFAAITGARAADVFGITQQIIPSSAKDETPMTCVYAPKP